MTYLSNSMRTKQVIRLPYIFLVVGAFCLTATWAGAQIEPGNYKFIDVNLAIGDSEGSLAFSLNYDRGVGKRKKIIIGLAGRLTSYLGKNQYYVTAPAVDFRKHGSRGSFQGNIDTLLRR